MRFQELYELLVAFVTFKNLISLARSPRRIDAAWIPCPRPVNVTSRYDPSFKRQKCWNKLVRLFNDISEWSLIFELSNSKIT